ncbi:MAG: Diacylglycerol kinase [Actinomycetia bacterium]|nr:Diacylglycerol kinase [Actinomycetes bacterium]
MTPPADGFLVVANPRAGASDRRAIDAAIGRLAEAGPVEARLTSSTDELDDVLAEVGGRVLVVAGGDGTLHAVVQRLRDRGELATTVLGLVPLGTGNDLARSLGLAVEVAEAAWRIATGTDRRIDLLVDDVGRVVVNAAHAGIGAEAGARADDLKARLGAAAYPVGALLAGARTDGWRLDITVDGRSLALPGPRVLQVGVGNGGFVGGGTPLCPGADPSDGLLDVVVSTAVGPGARVAYANALRTGDHIRRDDVVAERGVEVRISGDPVGHNADGEVAGDVTTRTYRVEAGAWTLRS